MTKGRNKARNPTRNQRRENVDRVPPEDNARVPPEDNARVRFQSLRYAYWAATTYFHHSVQRIVTTPARIKDYAVARCQSVYSPTSTNVRMIDMYMVFALLTAGIQAISMAVFGPVNSFLSGLLTCFGTIVLAGCLRNRVKREPEDLFRESVMGLGFRTLWLHLVIVILLGLIGLLSDQ